MDDNMFQASEEIPSPPPSSLRRQARIAEQAARARRSPVRRRRTSRRKNVVDQPEPYLNAPASARHCLWWPIAVNENGQLCSIPGNAKGLLYRQFWRLSWSSYYFHAVSYFCYPSLAASMAGPRYYFWGFCITPFLPGSSTIQVFMIAWRTLMQTSNSWFFGALTMCELGVQEFLP